MIIKLDDGGNERQLGLKGTRDSLRENVIFSVV